MAHFTLVINDVTPEDFDKLINVQTKAAKEIKFIPQGAQQQQPPSLVGSAGLNTHPQTGAYSLIRFEWGHAGVEEAVKLLHVFHKKAEEQKQ